MKKIILILIILFTTTQTILAQTLQYDLVSYGTNDKSARTPFFDLSFLNQGKFTIQYQSFQNAFQFAFDLIIGVSIATAVILFMVSAFQAIISGDNVGNIQKARDGMKNSIFGLMIVLSTWLILNTINPDLIRLPMFTALDSIGKTTRNTTQTGQPNVQIGSAPDPQNSVIKLPDNPADSTFIFAP